MNSPRLLLCSALPSGLSTGGFAYEVVLAAAGGEQASPPEWIQLAPRGEVVARDGRRFALDPERLVAQFRLGGVDLPIDFEHETEFTSTLGARPARGWIVELEARPEGLFGRVQWLADAVQALAARAYRYISPTLWLDPDKRTARALKAAALVSAPALAGLPAIASAHGETDMKDVLVALGLAETATQPEAVTAIAALKAGALDKFVPKAQHDETVAALSAANARLKTIDEEAATARCTALVDGAVAAGKLAPRAREQYLALAAQAYDQTKAAIDAMPALLKAGVDPLLSAADPAAGVDGQLSDQERQIAARLGVSEADFLKSRG